MCSDMIRTELEHHRRSTDTQKLPALITVVAFFWTGLAVSIVQQPIHADPLQAIAGPAQSRLSAVRLDGNYFSRDGHRFIPVGANWIPASVAMQWPTQWNPKAIEADFARMRELGFNTIRLDFLWAWIEPRPGDTILRRFATSISWSPSHIAITFTSIRVCSSAARWAKLIGIYPIAKAGIRILIRTCSVSRPTMWQN